MGCLTCLPAYAQFRTFSDDRGVVVFTNESAATPAKATSIASPSKAPAAGTASSIAAPASSSLNAARPTTPQELDQLVQKTAEKHQVDPRLVRAVIATESNWNTGAVSKKGAQGLMQLQPDTAQKLGVADAFDPAQNVDGGVRYLSMMLDRYHGDMHLALAAYNAGPGAVDRSGGVPQIAETRNYVQKVTSAYLGGTGLQPPTIVKPMPIYRAVNGSGRVVFTNE
jgi:soluble lytic murein transglycosylase-like protein